jgi:hypothetical protein
VPVELDTRHEDELDALIEEARRRARRRRLGYLGLAVAATVTAGSAYLAITGGGDSGTSDQSASSAPVATCRPSNLVLSSRLIQPMYGMDAVLFAVTSRSRAPCSIGGYPHVELLANGRSLRFRYRRGGDPYITTREPSQLTLTPGAPGFFDVAKYRCDAGAASPPASTVRVTLPGSSVPVRYHSPTIREADLQYSNAAHGPASSDPGNTVGVSPVSPRSSLGPG